MSIASVAVAAAGNLLEWYDFAIFGIFAPYIGLAFFPHDQNATCASLDQKHHSAEDVAPPKIFAYALFAGAFFVRPLGGALFGVIGDRLGRSHALLLTILLMAMPTLAIAALPGRARIGDLAIVALACLRLVQGIAAGGEMPGALVYAVESAPPLRKGFYGALVQASGVGSVLANGVAALLSNVLGDVALCEWGWRLAFLAGGVGALGIYCIRRSGIAASPEWQSARRSGAIERQSMATTLRTSWRSVLLIAFAQSFGMAGYYLFFVWLTTEVQSVRGASQAFASTSVLNIFWAIVVLASGYVADWLAAPLAAAAPPRCFKERGGGGGCACLVRTSTLGLIPAVTASATVVLAPFLFASLSTAPLTIFYGLQILAIACHAAYTGPLQAWHIEGLPNVGTRYAIMGVAYNLSSSLFGGTAPLIASALTALSGVTGVGIYLSAITCLSVGAVCTGELMRRRSAMHPLFRRDHARLDRAEAEAPSAPEEVRCRSTSASRCESAIVDESVLGA